MELFNVDTIEETLNKLFNEYKNSNNILPVYDILLINSLGKILANDIISNINVPEFDRSTVDGYAVIASDTNGSTETIPTFFEIVSNILMGEDNKISLNNNQCVYVPTGAMIPKNATAVVMVEDCENFTNNKIAVYKSISDGKNIVKIGDDIKKGNIVLKKGKKITYSDIGLLSSIGIDKIKVYKTFDITIISTGDEIIKNTEELSNGKVRDINTNLLIAMSKKFGFNVSNNYLLKDDANVLRNTISDSLDKSDVIVISGGSSKGKKDFTSLVINDLISSKVLTHGIAIKPGKPTITSYDSKTNTFVIGLPGHPVASAILFNLIVNGIYKMITNEINTNKFCIGKLCENVFASPGRKTYILVNIDEELNIKPIYGKSSLIRTLSMANGYIVLELNKEGINKGEYVKAYYL